MPVAFDQALNKPALSEYVEMYILDCSNIGGSIFRFCPATNNGVAVVYDGNTYSPLPIKTEGWEWSSTGAPPRPTLTVSNVNKFLQGAVQTLGDIVGAKLTRIRTFKQFIDGQPGADINAKFPDDVYVVEQKTTHNRLEITWVLSSVIDRPGLRLPRRQILRDKGFPGAARVRRI